MYAPDVSMRTSECVFIVAVIILALYNWLA